MDRTALTQVRLTQRFAAAPDRVFDAWLDPALAGRWLFATASDPASRVAINARVGGEFRFVLKTNGTRAEHAGRYTEIARPRRLGFTLAQEKRRRGPSRVSVEIVPLATGCELVLTHDGVPAGDAGRVEGRWSGMLYGLSSVVNCGTRINRSGSGKLARSHERR